MHSKHKKFGKYSDEWYAKNRDKILSESKIKYREDPHTKQVKQSYYDAHRDELREYRKRYYYAHREDQIRKAALWKKNHKDRADKSNKMHFLKKLYGMTLDEYNQLLKKQHGVCAICGKEETWKGKKTLSVDHNHKTGEIRGLLCMRCNRAIGFWEDNPKYMKAAISYLKVH